MKQKLDQNLYFGGWRPNWGLGVAWIGLETPRVGGPASEWVCTELEEMNLFGAQGRRKVRSGSESLGSLMRPRVVLRSPTRGAGGQGGGEVGW